MGTIPPERERECVVVWVVSCRGQTRYQWTLFLLRGPALESKHCIYVQSE